MTIDRALRFYDQRGGFRPNVDYAALAPDVTIMEIKFAAGDREDGAVAFETIPLTASRCSKYVLGVQAILRG
jgi:hypothetical protein